MITGISPETITAYATVGMLALALFAVVVALRQIHVMKEVEAYNAYENYHHFILQYSQLACGNFDFAAASHEDRFRYITLVMSMLLTVGRVMALFGSQPEWDASFEDDLNLHRNFLCSPEFGNFIGTMDAKVVRFIERTAIKLNWDYPYKNWKRPSR